MTGDGKQQEARELRQLLIDAMHIIQAEVPEQGRRGWANTLAKIRSVLEYPAKDEFQPSHASGEPSISYTLEQLNLMLDRRGQDEFQRGQQAMAEKAAQHRFCVFIKNVGCICGWLSESCGVKVGEGLYANHLRSLAGAEPQPAINPNDELQVLIHCIHEQARDYLAGRNKDIALTTLLAHALVLREDYGPVEAIEPPPKETK